MAGVRIEQLQVELLDADWQLVQDVTDRVALNGSSLFHANHATIHGGCLLTFLDPLTWPSARLRVTVDLTDLATEQTVSRAMGVYVPNTPEEAPATTPAVYSVEGYDVTYLLDTPRSSPYTLASGASYLTAVTALLEEAGVLYDVDPTAAAEVLPSARTWPVTDDNTLRAIINELLQAVGYRAVYADRAGRVQAEPYAAPATKAITRSFSTAAAGTVLAGPVRTTDVHEVPNRWVAYLTDATAALPVVGAGIYVVENQSDGLASRDSRGYWRTRVLPLDAADHAALVARTDAIVARDKHPQEWLELQALPSCDLWHADVVAVTAAEYGYSSQRFTVNGWDLPLDGGPLTVEARRVRT